MKSALIPAHKDRYELALIFDSQLIDSDWYGNDVFEHILPSLNKESTCSILCGDIIADYLPCETVHDILLNDMVQIHPTIFKYPTQYFVVYINNLSSLHKDTIITSLITYNAFVGYVDTTFMSLFKSLISRSLVSICIKYKDIMILRHEDDKVFGAKKLFRINYNVLVFVISQFQLKNNNRYKRINTEQ